MKNNRIQHSREEVKIYADHYKPSFNLYRVFKGILGVFIFGTSSTAQSFVPVERKRMK